MKRQELRACARAGCGTVFVATRRTAKYCSDACRSAAWKDRAGYVDHRRSGAYRHGRRAGERARSGLQVSYRRLVAALEDAFAHDPRGRAIALETAWACLPDRQRQRLEAGR